jgi:hypothetical protein
MGQPPQLVLEEKVLLGDESMLLRTRWRQGRTCAWPHVDGPCPHIVDRGPGTSWCAAGLAPNCSCALSCSCCPPLGRCCCCCRPPLLLPPRLVRVGVPVGSPHGVESGSLRGLLQGLSGGGESDGRRRLLVRHGELLQSEILAGRRGRKGRVEHDEGGHRRG